MSFVAFTQKEWYLQFAAHFNASENSLQLYVPLFLPSLYQEAATHSASLIPLRQLFINYSCLDQWWKKKVATSEVCSPICADDYSNCLPIS